jgi:oligopeptide transport system substrate-binding protein
VDPDYFLSLYVTGSGQNDAGWTDETYEALLADANRTLDAGVRMRKLAECEYRFMKAMPVLPLFYNTWTYLQKPFVRGLGGNALDLHPFKYVWIDTEWRPQ